jgi:tyrosyl-tRNA synthetase
MTTLMEGTDGRKMSSSWGNVINLTDEPNDMFGKVMSINDNLIKKYFILATRVETKKVDEIVKLPNPRDQKLILAEEITALYHGKAPAEKAKSAFINQFSKGGLPEDIETQRLPAGEQLVTTTVAGVMKLSKSEVRRLIDQGGLRVDGQVVKKDYQIVIDGKPKLIQAGKRKFVNIVAKNK